MGSNWWWDKDGDRSQSADRMGVDGVMKSGKMETWRHGEMVTRWHDEMETWR